MADERDDTAKIARARDLRERIRKLIAGEEAGQDTDPPPSPRDFIHKRMRESDKD
ncbi:MAG TPA: hypothetical protein VF759_02285 [Allosphingosinicella sp.]|jgi:hypothetical protein